MNKGIEDITPLREKRWFHVLPKEGRPYGFSITDGIITDHPDWSWVKMDSHRVKKHLLETATSVTYVASNWIV